MGGMSSNVKRLSWKMPVLSSDRRSCVAAERLHWAKAETDAQWWLVTYDGGFFAKARHRLESGRPLESFAQAQARGPGHARPLTPCQTIAVCDWRTRRDRAANGSSRRHRRRMRRKDRPAPTPCADFQLKLEPERFKVFEHLVDAIILRGSERLINFHRMLAKDHCIGVCFREAIVTNFKF